MAFRHGVYTMEVPTSLLPSRAVDSNVVFAVGTAAICKLNEDSTTYINKPRCYYSYDEFVTEMGWDSDNFSKYSLQELVKSHFALYRGSPLVAVNVFDPKVHRSNIEKELCEWDKGVITLKHQAVDDIELYGTVIRDVPHSASEIHNIVDNKGKLDHERVAENTFKLPKPESCRVLEEDVDYSVDYTNGTISKLPGGSLADDAVIDVQFVYTEAKIVTQTVTNEKVTLVGGTGTIGTIPPTGIASATIVEINGGVTYALVEGTDYTINYTTGDITAISTGSISSPTATLAVTYDYNINIFTNDVQTKETILLAPIAARVSKTDIKDVIVFERFAATDDPLVEDTDYTLDHETGKFTLVDNWHDAFKNEILKVSYQYDKVSSTPTAANAENVTLVGGVGVLANTNQVSNLIVSENLGGVQTTMIDGTDYIFDASTATITRISSGAISSDTATLDVSYIYMVDSTTKEAVIDEEVELSDFTGLTANTFIESVSVRETRTTGDVVLVLDRDYTVDTTTGVFTRLTDNVDVAVDYNYLVATPFTNTYTENSDFEVNKLWGTVTKTSESTIPDDAIIEVSYSFADVDKVDVNDIIGGIDLEGNSLGLELIDSVFPMYRLVPGSILCPKYGEKPEVAIVMTAKSYNINGVFNAIAITDIPSDEGSGVTRYTEVPAYKQNNNLSDPHLIVCWPKVRLGDEVYGLATHLTGLISKTDYSNEGIPYESASNKNLSITSIGYQKADGTWEELALGMDKVNSLNGEGIYSALNWDGGLRSWGGRVSCYPINTDPKDCQEPIRRMFNWYQNTFVLTYFQKVDSPLTRRFIQTILRSETHRLEGYTSREILLGGQILFKEDENTATDLIDGIVRFHIYFTPPPAARQIEGIFEFDVNNMQMLFS